MNLMALSGSLRKQSLNTRLLQALQRVSAQPIEMELATLHGIPLYDGDLEAREGIPEAVNRLREQIQSSNGVIIAMPEYNGGMPGVLKNALDWLTRPPSEMAPTFFNRPLALCGATPGGLGTALAQSGSLTVLRQLKVQLFPEHLRVSRAHEALSSIEALDDSFHAQLHQWLESYASFIRQAA
ncbi:MAG: NAD(P)H-dependent oxidoreductase [Pseudomonadota bacterium]